MSAVHRLCLELRQALGENPRRLGSTPPPGTRSLAAYQTLLAAGAAGDNFALIAVARKAIEHDPDWATPYFHIGIGYGNLGDWREFRNWAEEARSRSTGLPELERMIIEAGYLEAHYRFDEDVEILRSIQHLYPFEIVGYDFLAWDYNNIFEDPVSAEPVYRKAYELNPSAHVFWNLASTLHLLGKPDASDLLVAEHLSEGGK